MDAQVQENPDESRYELLVEDQLAGYVEYRDRGDEIELTHTEVDSSYEGQGLGSQLARGVLDRVRQDGRGLLPSCPFISRYLQRHPEYAELVPAERRPRFGL